MRKSRRSRNSRGTREFRVVARGYPRAKRDLERLQRASIDFVLAERERQAQEELARLAETNNKSKEEGSDV